MKDAALLVIEIIGLTVSLSGQQTRRGAKGLLRVQQRI